MGRAWNDRGRSENVALVTQALSFFESTSSFRIFRRGLLPRLFLSCDYLLVGLSWKDDAFCWFCGYSLLLHEWYLVSTLCQLKPLWEFWRQKEMYATFISAEWPSVRMLAALPLRCGSFYDCVRNFFSAALQLTTFMDSCGTRPLAILAEKLSHQTICVPYPVLDMLCAVVCFIFC